MSYATVSAPPLLALEGPRSLAALPAPPPRGALPSAPQRLLALESGRAPPPTVGPPAAVPPAVASAVGGGNAKNEFVPSYDWQAVPEGALAPPGLEYRLAMDGSGARTARIPPSWRMLVVAQPQNEGCRVDVTRTTPLADVRVAIAAKLADGDMQRVDALFADDVLIAGGGAGSYSWIANVDEANVFGRRMTCTVLPDSLCTQMDSLEDAVTDIERALGASKITVASAHGTLAQLEAKLDRLQCKGIDSADPVATSEEARLQRRQLTRRAELLQARLSGIFVGLNAARQHSQMFAASATLHAKPCPCSDATAAQPRSLVQTPAPSLAAAHTSRAPGTEACSPMSVAMLPCSAAAPAQQGASAAARFAHSQSLIPGTAGGNVQQVELLQHGYADHAEAAADSVCGCASAAAPRLHRCERQVVHVTLHGGW
eukprot:CAMPEP_0117515620 /NCGR_PEP_ID=MMETSP0784-20121206/30674_1 /TAXON_ID=39447 /ORGANISM="" /LENGTH=428 /DNA_ID=CAMNT_0005311443 /DNA_START=1 /DNA_END=1288 /DNA_ORIENTATION=+